MDLNVAIKNIVGNQKKKYYNYDKKEYFVKDYRQTKKLSWKPIFQKNASIVNIERNIVMIERILSSIDFKSVFTSISLNILDIELEEDSDIDESEEFNADVQIYLIFKKKYKEFIVINVNLSITKNDGEEHLYNKDDLYFEFNNAGYDGIIQMNYIYNCYRFYLRPKIINNFFFKTIFKFIKKVY